MCNFSPEGSVEFGIVVLDLHNVCAGNGGIGAMQSPVALLPQSFALDCRGGVWKAGSLMPGNLKITESKKSSKPECGSY